MRLFGRTRTALVHIFLAAGLAACGGGDNGGTGPDGDGDGDGGGGASGTALTSGTPLTNRSGDEGDTKLYRITVPTGATSLVVETSGGTGDLDLYVRQGQEPTASSHDCESAGSDSDERCELEDPEAGTWYILLAAFEDYEGVTLTATVTGGGDGGDGGDGGTTDGYTLAVAPATATLAQGGTTALTVTATRGSYTGSITLDATGLPAGVSADAASIASGATSATITLSASAGATLGTSTITVSGSASGQTTRTATASLTVSAPSGTPVVWRSVSIGSGHGCGVTTSDVGYCWGGRSSGATGDGVSSSGYHSRPNPVAGGLSFAEIVAGASNSCGRTTGGQLYCWGANDANGKLGIGTTYTAELSPVQVSLPGPVAQVALAQSHTCALTTAGDAYCWGANANRQVSDQAPTIGGVTTPLQTAAGRAYSEIGVGGSSTSCALTATGGAVWCWGFDNFGIGDGTAGTGSSSSWSPPVQVLGGPYVQLAVGYYHMCALTAAGQVYCWGGNAYGETGVTKPTGSFPDPTNTPQLVGGGHTFKQVVAGYMSTCALTTAGAAYCWGTNWDGLQLGNGSTDRNYRTSTPTAVAGGLTFESLSRGHYKSYCGITAAGATYCWGSNNTQQLGSDAAPQYQNSAVPVRLNNPL